MQVKDHLPLRGRLAGKEQDSTVLMTGPDGFKSRERLEAKVEGQSRSPHARQPVRHVLPVLFGRVRFERVQFHNGSVDLLRVLPGVGQDFLHSQRGWAGMNLSELLRLVALNGQLLLQMCCSAAKVHLRISRQRSPNLSELGLELPCKITYLLGVGLEF
jgi:hypothetical protein